MNQIIECVPNISEGKNEGVVKEIVNYIDVEGVKILDYSSDPDHNRSVITMIGDYDSLKISILKLFEKAIEKIDLRKHSGEHPRMGAVDVVPFIPIKNTTEKECIELSKEVAKEVAERFAIPVYLYEKSATKSDRKNLSKIRKGEFEGFFEKIKDPDWKPDYGPDRVHESAGVTAIGCRPFLIAFNINLATSDIKIADKIAKAVRHISGGFRFCKALGMEIKERGIVQISMNMTNYKKTPIFRVFEAVKREAARYGVNVLGSEIVGLVPQEALLQVAEFYLQIENFDNMQVLENKIWES